MIFISFVIGILREAIAKKIILSLIIIYLCIIVLIFYFINLESVDAMQSLLQATSSSDYSQAIINIEANWILHGFTLFVFFTLFIILVSSFIPSMLKKGHIDLLLSKPISRTNIILGHFAAGIIFVFLALLSILGVVWLVFSIKSGVWNFRFLYSVFWFTYIFAVLYSLIILIATITKSTILTILINQLMLFPVTYIFYSLNNYVNGAAQGLIGGVGIFLIKFFYYILPKPWDLHTICQNTIACTAVESYQSVFTSLLFIAVMLSATTYYFSKKDY